MLTGVYEAAGEPVRHELLSAFDRAWGELGAPGTWWSAAERVEMCRVARAAREGATTTSDLLPDGAVEAASLLAAAPATTTEAWVRSICDGIGELRYVELVGIVARVSAMDTFHRLTGRAPAALPEPAAGEPARVPPPEGLRKNRTWVSMAMPVPPFVLGAVPSAMAAMNDLSDVLYMPMAEMADPDWKRGELHRTQVELVAASTSHVNECFY